MTSTKLGVPRHVPQVQVKFPFARPWHPHGPFERFALWPQPGEAATFALPHWTAYYRWKGRTGDAKDASDRPACCQIFVCRGAIELPESDGSTRTVSAGDFKCGMYSEADLVHAPADQDLLMVVKYQADNLATIDSRFHPKDRLAYLPYFYGHGEVNDFSAALLHGNPFGYPTNLAAVVRFPERTIVSSHFHDEPIFHEFIYLQGGHMTPDGFYAPGDHVTSIPLCKEGPWLATFEPSVSKIPSSWRTFAPHEDLIRHAEAPFAEPFMGDAAGQIHGLLFVHGGPFARLTLGVNWHVIGDDEFGPRG